jgi:DNA-binding MurR/RpiR family transcriptional regulator
MALDKASRPGLTLQDHLAALHDGLSPAERKVAALVAADPAGITRQTLATVARSAGVSEPTVVRFCRTLGLEGFAELRLALARAEGAGPLPRRGSLAGTPAAEAASAFCEAAIAEVTALREQLDPAALEAAARLLLAARQVEIWGFGDAAPLADVVAPALLGLCRGVVARGGARMQAMAAAGLEADSAVLCLSARGGASGPVRAAMAAGAQTVALAPAGSPLCASADIALGYAAGDAAGPMARGPVLLALAGALAGAVEVLASPAARDRAARMREAGA